MPFDAKDENFYEEFIRRVRFELPGHRIEQNSKILNSYARTTAFREIKPYAVIYPKTTKEVQKIVYEANQYRIALYPISRFTRFYKKL